MVINGVVPDDPPPGVASTAPPMGLYVHIPWCVRKCPYCDFNSHQAKQPVDQQAFVASLLADLRVEVATSPVPPIQSLFIGGGTPSLFSDRAIGTLLDGIAACVSLDADCEITLEANPGAADAGHFRGYRAAGVNRLSIGVQSMNADRLAALGRIHSPAQALRAVDLARTAGFDNVNLDLMYGLPGQSLAGALDDLRQLIACAPEHLSWYQLTLEPNTAFHRQPPPLPHDDLIADISEAGLQVLDDGGFARYEISAFARPEYRCRHNLNYWQFGDYLGIGPGAHGKRTLADGSIWRRSKRRGPADYQENARAGGLSREWPLNAEDRVVEFFLNTLRLVEGVPAGWFPARTGLALDSLVGSLRQGVERGLLVDDAERICATPSGLRFLNDLLALFTPA
jgi:oxygen-independent coproporphyrinogen-3 oxidase